MLNQKKTGLYRSLEIFPGALTWGTFIGAVVFSYFFPYWIAIYIILFDIYWVLKAINTSLHLFSSFLKMKLYAAYNWKERLELIGDLEKYKQSLRQKILSSKNRRETADLKHELWRLDNLDFSNRLLDFRKICHLVILATTNESLGVLEGSIKSIVDSDFPKNQIFFVLATEEREAGNVRLKARILSERYGKKFMKFLVSTHPDGTPGEAKVKGANLTFAAKQALPILKELQIATERVIVSAFDSDTVVSRIYFSYLTYAFLTTEKPHRTSYQPMPVYNNNIWDAPAITRVVAVANSFWQMVEASRPDRLVTFSSHSISLRTLLDVDFWPVDVIPDDSRIFWKGFIHYHGDYRTMPLFTTLSFDAVLDNTYFKSLISQYKQKRRWAWGVCEIPFVVSNIWRDRLIPFWKKFIYTERLVEGHYFWATASIMIAGLGWLPLILGGARFDDGVFAANLPFLTRTIMQTAMIFLIVSVYINMVIIPPRPAKYSRWKSVNMIAQWIFVPIVSTVFGSAPAVDAQTRLMFGKYMEFWVTPKERKL